MINKQMLQFPINYGNTWGMKKIAFGWGAHETVADECKAAGIEKALIEASDRWFQEVERLLKDLDIQTGNLNSQFGLTKEDCAHIIKYQYSNDYAREGNPRDYNYEEIYDLFTSLL